MYRFIKEKDKDNKFDNTDVELKSESQTIPDLLDDFEDFLRGCGFRFNGSIQIVEEEE